MNDSMTAHDATRCPVWCTDHRGSCHRTESRTVPTFGEDVSVHAFRFGDSEERIAIGGQTFTLGQASDIARHILRTLNEVETPTVAQRLDAGDVTGAAHALLDYLETVRA